LEMPAPAGWSMARPLNAWAIVRYTGLVSDRGRYISRCGLVDRWIWYRLAIERQIDRCVWNCWRVRFNGEHCSPTYAVEAAHHQRRRAITKKASMTLVAISVYSHMLPAHPLLAKRGIRMFRLKVSTRTKGPVRVL